MGCISRSYLENRLKLAAIMIAYYAQKMPSMLSLPVMRNWTLCYASLSNSGSTYCVQFILEFSDTGSCVWGSFARKVDKSR